MLGREGDDLGRLGRRGRCAADDPGLERDGHDGRLEPRVEPDDLARLDEEPGLLVRLADRRLVDGLVDLEEAAGLRPRALAGLDAAPDQDDLAGVGDREGRDDQARVDVDDVPARLAGEPIAVLAGDGAEDQRRAAARAEVERVRRSTTGRRGPTAGPSSGRRGRARASSVTARRLTRG